VCGSDTYKVHKAIVCAQSDFFRAACRPDAFNEGQTGTINIPAGQGRDVAFYSQPINEEGFDWELDVETAATVKLMINYLYLHDYLEEEQTKALVAVTVLCTRENRKGLLAEHSRMYAMGDKYGISGLKALAAAKFNETGVRCHAGLVDGLIIAFKATPDSDKELREVAISRLYPYRHTYKDNAEVQTVISRLPGLSYGLYRKLLAGYPY